MNAREIYKLTCHGCGHVLELPASDGAHPCPNCGAVLRVAWSAEHATFDQREQRRQPQQ